jgi:hypothetical protein
MNPDDIHVFVISWAGRHQDSLKIAREIGAHANKVSIVYSDPDDQIELPFAGAMKVPDSMYFGGKFKTCLDNCNSSLMLIIQADASCDNWPDLIGKCKTAFLKIKNLGTWAPLVDYTAFHLGRTFMSKLHSGNYNLVAQTDCTVFAIPKIVQDRLSALHYENNVYGWGMDWTAISFGYANKMVAIVDESVKVLHPQGSNYNREAAYKQMLDFLRQLTLEEQIQFHLLQAFVDFKQFQLADRAQA